MPLPQKLFDKIERESINFGIENRTISPYIAYRRGATEYAIKLYQADDKIVLLQAKIEKLSKENYDVSGQMQSLENSAIRQTEAFCESISWGETARALLEKLIFRHEAGLLPDLLLYNEINSFLNGTK